MAKLFTERLILRPPEVTDIPAIVKYANNKTIADFTLNIPYPYSQEDAVHFLSNVLQHIKTGKQSTFAILLKDNPEVIGFIGLKTEPKHKHAEMGYWIGEPFWNKGYITEAIGALLAHGFNDLGLHKIFAHHMQDNPGSGKVMIKNGMKQEGVLKEHIFKNGRFQTMILYGILESDYRALASYKT